MAGSVALIERTVRMERCKDYLQLLFLCAFVDRARGTSRRWELLDSLGARRHWQWATNGLRMAHYGRLWYAAVAICRRWRGTLAAVSHYTPRRFRQMSDTYRHHYMERYDDRQAIARQPFVLPQK